jgi:hypothetical protein
MGTHTDGTIHRVRISYKPYLYRRRDDSTRDDSTRNIYASLKAQINDKLKCFRERDSVCYTDNRLCKSNRIHDKQHPVLEPLVPFSNDLNLSVNSPSSPGENESFRPPIRLTRKVAGHIKDWRSESVRCLITRPKPVQEPETHSQQNGDKIGRLRTVDEGTLNTFPGMQDNQVLGKAHSAYGYVLRDPMGSRHSRRMPSPLSEERNLMDVAPEQSYFHTSSDSDSESIRQSHCSRIISKIKKNTSGWIRDAFTLDEHEKAFFEFRRNISTDWISQQYSSPVFIDGSRVVRGS